jgi:ribonuclease HII
MVYLCGIDEAGRGPIAGPVCAAAVVLPKQFPFELLADSKKLSPKRRVAVAKVIKEQALGWAVAWSSRKEIDQINILQATMCAMQRAYRKIERQNLHVDLILVDGNRTPEMPIPCQSIIKGDDSVYEIMAASILAKTARDEVMTLLDMRYPLWGFAQHKGYPTKAHREACRLHGLSPIHRKTFSF